MQAPGVKGADLDAPGQRGVASRQHGGDAFTHLLGGLIRERQRQDMRRVGAALHQR